MSQDKKKEQGHPIPEVQVWRNKIDKRIKLAIAMGAAVYYYDLDSIIMGTVTKTRGALEQ